MSPQVNSTNPEREKKSETSEARSYKEYKNRCLPVFHAFLALKIPRMELGWGSVRGVFVLFCVLVLRGIIQAPVCGHPPGCSSISSAQGVRPHGVTTTLHTSVTTSRHNASPAAPGAASANRVYSMPFPVRLPKSGACSLPEALVQLLSKPCASRGGWTPSVYPLKYVLGFQVNVCNFFFPYMNKFGFDFFFLQRIKCKKFVL